MFLIKGYEAAMLQGWFFFLLLSFSFIFLTLTEKKKKYIGLS